MRRPVAPLALVAALACNPFAARRAPSPASDATIAALACVDAALEASSLVAEVTSVSGRDQPRTRRVLLMSPPGPRIREVRFAVEPNRGAPRQLAVEYRLPTAGGIRPDPMVADLEGRAVGEIGERLLRDVRARCASTRAGPPTCAMVQQGRLGRCTVGM